MDQDKAAFILITIQYLFYTWQYLKYVRIALRG
jgi:hypothetical protein